MKIRALFFIALVIASNNSINSMNNSSNNKVENANAVYLVIMFNNSINSMNNSSENNNKIENSEKVYFDDHKSPWNRLARVASQEKNEELGRKSGYYGEHITVLRMFQTLHPQNRKQK
jgi:hypothetical protein